MTPLKCVHLNSVTKFILITILVSIFSQSFDCKPTNNVTITTSGQGDINQPIDNGTRPESYLNKCTYMLCVETVSPTRNTKALVVKRSIHPPDYNFGNNKTDDDLKEMDLPTMAFNTRDENPLALNSLIVESIKAEVDGYLSIANSSLLREIRTNGDSSYTIVMEPIKRNATSDEIATLSNGPDISNPSDQINQINIVSSSSSSSSSNISESETVNENNYVTINSTTTTSASTTMEPLMTPDPTRIFTPFIPNEVEKREESSTIQSGIDTTSTLTTATSNPIDEISAPTTTSRSYDLKEVDLPTVEFILATSNCTQCV